MALIGLEHLAALPQPPAGAPAPSLEKDVALENKRVLEALRDDCSEVELEGCGEQEEDEEDEEDDEGEDDDQSIALTGFSDISHTESLVRPMSEGDLVAMWDNPAPVSWPN